MGEEIRNALATIKKGALGYNKTFPFIAATVPPPQPSSLLQSQWLLCPQDNSVPWSGLPTSQSFLFHSGHPGDESKKDRNETNH